MKAATIILALLVAVLILAPTPVGAAGLPDLAQAQGQSATEQATADTPPTPNEESEDASGIAELHATAARLRGRVELSWRTAEGAGEGAFVVERSTNGSSWRPVKACSQRVDPEQPDYSCTDTRLTSGTTYSYRVCIAAKGTTCSNAAPSEPVTVKAP